MSRLKRIFAVLFLAVFAGIFVAHMAAAAPFSTGVGGTGTTTPFGILVGDGTAGDPLKTLLLSGCTFSGGTLTCNSGGGAGSGTISTSTAAVIGNLLYFTSPNQVGNVATTTVSCSGSASCTSFVAIGSSPVTITASGGTGGTGTVSTSTHEVSGTLPIWTTNSATPALLGNSNLSQSAGTTLINGVTAIIDGGGDWLSNIFQNGPVGVITQPSSTSTAILGSLVQAGGILQITGNTVITPAQFCGTGEVVVASTTAADVTITIPNRTWLQNFANLNPTVCSPTAWPSSFAEQFIFNNGSHNVFENATDTSEVIEYAPGTPSALPAGASWEVSGQLSNEYNYPQGFGGSNSTVRVYTQSFSTAAPSAGLLGENVGTGAYYTFASSSLFGFIPTKFAWTPNSWGNATGTTLGFQNGFISNASSTISGSLWDTLLSGGLLYLGQNGQVQSAATSSLNASITGSAGSVANALTINNSGSGAASGSTYNGSGALTISYNTIGAQVAGNYATFAYPFINSATTSALTLNGGIVVNAASTTFTNSPFFTALAGGAVISNPNGSLYNQATTSVSCTGSASCTGFTVFGSSPITINATGGAGLAGGTWSTTTSQVAGELINYSNNNSDVVTIGGNATSTAAAYIDPNQVAGPFFMVAGSSTPFSRLGVLLYGNAVHANTAFYIGSTTPTGATTTLFSIDAQGNVVTLGNVGVASSSPGTLLSVGNTNGLNFTTGTSTFNSTGGINLAAGCFAVAGTCVSGSGSVGGAVSIPVQLATTGALPANTYAGGVLTEVGTGALTVDGTAAVVGNRVLVKNEVAQTNNGIYSVTAAGSGIAAYVLTRVSDYNSSANVIPGEATYVIGGTTLSDDWWALQTVAPITVGGGGSGSNLTYLETNAAGVTSVTGTYPVLSSGGATPAISLAFGTTTANTWSTFNNFTGGASTTQLTVSNTFFDSTNSAGTAGQVLGIVSGKPTWVATSTSGGGGGRGTTASSVEIPFSDCTPEAASTRQFVGGAFFEPWVGVATSQFTPEVMAFGAATTSAMDCIVHVPANYSSGGSFQMTALSTTTAGGVGVVAVELSDVPQQNSAYLTPAWTESWPASTTAADVIRMPTSANTSTTTGTMIATPTLTAGDDMFARLTRYSGASVSDTVGGDIGISKLQLNYTGN